ncbi:MAG: hypothetical protein R6U10_04425 [Thermoplasmatota archaeon]
MRFGKVTILFLLVVLLLPAASACFVSSGLTANVDQPQPVPSEGGDSVRLEANVTFTWGFGAFLPLATTINVDVQETPEWLAVSLDQNQISITPQGLFGGAISRTVSMTLTSATETRAGSYETFTLSLETPGNFLIQGTSYNETIQVSQEFVDNNITVELSDSDIRLKKGERQKVYLNMTNMCNGEVAVQVEVMNLSDAWEVTSTSPFYGRPLYIPSRYEGDDTASLPLTFKSSGATTEDIWLKITYQSTDNPARGGTYIEAMAVRADTEGISVGAIAAVVVGILVILVIVAVVWRKYRLG